MMQAGDLRKRITIFSPSETQDENGQSITTWTTVLLCAWAAIKPLSGTQLNLAQASTITSTATHQITIRYRPEMVGQVNCKIQYRAPAAAAKTYRVNAIMDTDERHVEMRIMVTEVVA